jgi:hypothetical protein
MIRYALTADAFPAAGFVAATAILLVLFDGASVHWLLLNPLQYWHPTRGAAQGVFRFQRGWLESVEQRKVR